jgi:TRAP-type C4-dicarboxylate transport system permease small subunit
MDNSASKNTFLLVLSIMCGASLVVQGINLIGPLLWWIYYIAALASLIVVVRHLRNQRRARESRHDRME